MSEFNIVNYSMNEVGIELLGQVKRDKIVRKKHLPRCSGPGASSAFCGFPQKQAAQISSENEKSLSDGDFVNLKI